MARLVVRLFGGFHVELDGEAVYDFETDKVRALLAYLVVEADRPHRRETLASLLWPDRPDSVARTNLRLALSRLRSALRDRDSDHKSDRDRQRAYSPFLFVTSSDIQFNTSSDYALDVAELEGFAHPDAEAAGTAEGRLLPEALCADFLAGFAAPDSEAFEAWVLNRQEHCHRLALDILDTQAAYFECVGEYAQAAAAARLQLRLEPWLEEAHQRCMADLALAGRREEALQQYETCRRILHREFGLDSTTKTQALYEDIRSGKLSPDRRGGSRTRPESRGQPPPGQPPPGQPQGLPLLVARADQLVQLAVQLDRALAGEPGVVFISGDAGSGKTVLLEAFAESAMAGHPDLLVAGARCNPGGNLDAFAPLRRLAELLFGDLANHTAWRLHGPEQAVRLQAATGPALAALAEHGPDLVGTLISETSVTRRVAPRDHSRINVRPELAPIRGRPTPTPLSQGILFDELLATLAVLAQTQPLLLLLDDLHWVDDATAAFLLRLGRELGDSPILVAGAYRSATVALGRRDPRSGETVRHPLAEVINELRRAKGEILVDLDRVDGRAFVESYVDTEPNRLGAGFRDALCAQTGGHALFTVELLRNLQARGEIYRDDAGRWVAAESLDWGALPARVEAAIAERIDRLPADERRILAVASVQGDDFTGEITAELAGLPSPAALAALSGSLARQHHLVKPEGSERTATGERGLSVYRFTHHLFQKYLYDQLDPVERAQLHRAVAACLDRQIGDNQVERERLAARLAWHYEAAGLPLRAARALLAAGQQAMRVSAYREALARFDHGLALLTHEPASPQQGEVARLLEAARLGPERNLEGLASAGLAKALERAGIAGVGDVEGRPRLMMLVAEGERLSCTGRFADGLAVAEQLREQATQWDEEVFVALAHWRSGFIQNVLGNLREAERHFDWLLAWLTSERRAELRAAVGLDLTAHALAFSSLDLWWLGYGEKALARSAEALTGAVARNDLYGLAVASAIGTTLLFLAGADAAALQQRAEQCYRVCAGHGFVMWQIYAEVFLGRLALMHGEAVAGIEQMRGAVARWQAIGMTVGTDALAVALADSCLAAARGRGRDGSPTADRDGLIATGLATIAPVLGPDVMCGQSYQAELQRLQGELLLARDRLAATEEALACFQRATALARAKGALAWELRAAMSLVRLRERQGEAHAADLAEARRCLAEVYGRFTEGLAFPDLQEAAALIGL